MHSEEEQMLAFIKAHTNGTSHMVCRYVVDGKQPDNEARNPYVLVISSPKPETIQVRRFCFSL